MSKALIIINIIHSILTMKSKYYFSKMKRTYPYYELYSHNFLFKPKFKSQKDTEDLIYSIEKLNFQNINFLNDKNNEDKSENLNEHKNNTFDNLHFSNYSYNIYLDLKEKEKNIINKNIIEYKKHNNNNNKNKPTIEKKIETKNNNKEISNNNKNESIINKDNKNNNIEPYNNDNKKNINYNKYINEELYPIVRNNLNILINFYPKKIKL